MLAVNLAGESYRRRDRRAAYKRKWRQENRDRLREVHRVQQRAWKLRNPESVARSKAREQSLAHDYQSRSRFGVPHGWYAKQMKAQGGVCAICRQAESKIGSHGRVKRLAIDHCHTTGQVRGLLCEDCNLGLGRFMDDRSRLVSALEYLGRFV